MADNCVNRSAKEFKDLARQSVIKPIMLAAKVGLWQDKNNTTEFPKDVAEVNEIDNISTGQLEIDFDEADIQEADKKVMKKARSLALGEELTSKDIMKAKRADSDYIENILLRNKIGAFDKEYNKAGVLTAIAISPQMVKGREERNAFAAAQNYARILNNTMPNTKGVANIAEVEKAGNSARINIRLPRQMAIIRSYFPIRRDHNFLRHTRKLFMEEAVKDLYDNKQISAKEFLKIYDRRGMGDLSLTPEEVKDIAQRNINDNFTSITINGEIITEPGEYIDRVDDDVDEMPIGDEENSNPIDIDNYIKRREGQVEFLENKIESLRERRKITADNEKYNAEIGQMESLLKDITEDLETLKNDKGSTNIEKLERSFQVEYDFIENIHANPTEDNIPLAKGAIEFLGHHINRDARMNVESVIGSEEGYAEKELSNLVSRVAEKQRIYKEELTEISKKKFIEKLEQTSNNYTSKRNITEEEMFEELLRELDKDTDLISKLFSPLGRDFTVDDKLGRYIRYFHDLEANKMNREANKKIQKINDLYIKALPILKDFGYSSLEMFANTNSKGDLQIVSKFSEKWRNVLAEHTYINRNKRYEAVTSKNKKEYSRLLNEKHDRLNEISDRLDFRYLPEVQQGLGTEFLKKEFGGYTPDNKYANKLKKRLGETEYNNLVEKQINSLYDFERKIKKERVDFLNSRGVTRYEDLNENDKVTYNDYLTKRSNPKTIFEEGGKKKYDYKQEGKDRSAWINMDYNIFFPKEDMEVYYDDKFKSIEENKELLNLWKELRSAIRQINENYAGSSMDIPTNKSFFFFEESVSNSWFSSEAPFNTIFSSIRRAFINTKEAIQNTSTAKLQAHDPNGPVRISGNSETFKSKVDDIFHTDTDAIRSILEVDYTTKEFDYTELSSDQKTQIFKELGVSNEKEFDKVLNKYEKYDKKNIEFKALKNFSQAKVYRMQQADITVMIKSLLEMSAEYKARENSKNFVKNTVDTVIESKSKQGESIIPKRLKEKKEFFEKAVIDKFRNTAGEISKDKMEKLKEGTLNNDINTMLGRTFTQEEKRLRKIYKKEIDRNQRILDSLNPEDDHATYNELKNQITRRQKKMNTMGQHYTIKAIMEFVAIKLRIVGSLGLAPMTAIANYKQAKGQAIMQQGYKDENGELVGDYTEEQLMSSYNFVGAAMHNNFVTKQFKSKKKKEEIEKMHLIIQKLGVIQDGTDFMQRAERLEVGRKPTLNPLKKEARKLLILQEFTEYYNQVPIVLSRLMNYKMPDGSTFFDGKGFPHHEIKDGQLVLKESSKKKFKEDNKVDKEQSKSRYEDFDHSDAYSFAANIMSSIIPERNGDYTLSGVPIAKEHTVGRVVTLFSTWVAGIAHSAYGDSAVNMATGEEKGGYINNAFLSEEGRILYSAISGQSVVNSFFMAPLNTLFSNIPFFYFIASAMPIALQVGRQAIARKMTKGESTKAERSKAYWAQHATKLMLYNMSGGALTIGINKVAGLINSVAGTNIRAKDKFDYTFGGQLDHKTALAIRQNAKQQALLTFLSSLTTGFFMLISELGWEEEEKETDAANIAYQKEQESIESKIGDMIRKGGTNMLVREYADNAVTTNLHQLYSSIFKDEQGSGVFNLGLTASNAKLITDSFTEDDIYRGRGPYEGMPKWQVALRKKLPKMIRNIGMPEYAFGFGPSSERIYEKPMIYDKFAISDYKKERQKVRKRRQAFKDEWEQRHNYSDAPFEKKKIIEDRLDYMLSIKPELQYPRREEFDIDQGRIVDTANTNTSREIDTTKNMDYKDENNERLISPEEEEELNSSFKEQMDKDIKEAFGD